MAVITILDVLAAASLTGMAELNAMALNDLFTEAVRVEFTQDDQPLSKLTIPKKADEIRKFWTGIYTDRTFKEDHPVLKDDNSFTRDPKSLILANKLKHSTFNALALYGLGNKTNVRAGSASYQNKDDQKIGTGLAGNTVSPNASNLIMKANTKNDPNKPGSSSKNSTGSTTSSDPSKPPTTRNDPSKSSSSSKTSLEDFSKSLTNKFQSLLQDEIKIFSDKYDRFEEDLDDAKTSAANANELARDAQAAAKKNTETIGTIQTDIAQNSTDLNDLRTDLDSQTNKLATLTNEFHAIDGASFNPDTIDGYTLVQFYVLSKNSRSEYRKAVLSMRLNGLIVLDVNPEENETYIEIDEANPRGSEAKCNEIETKLAVDCHGNFDRSRRVKIKKATVIPRKNERFTILVQIDAVNKIRGTIVQRLINDRHLNQGHFGLRQDIPEQYNIDPWLMWLKNNAVDSVTGRKLIFGFDTNKSGYYVIYINDYEDKVIAEGAVNAFTNKPYTDKEKCSIIRPGCPREFAKLKLKYINKEDLLKLTKPDEYFCYGGHILKVPENGAFAPVR